MVVALVDDHRLLRLFADAELAGKRYATTCSWWWRLVSAFSGHGRGALSRLVSRLGPGTSETLRHRLETLPSLCEIVDLRLLMPQMATLARGRSLNLLAAEAAAAAAYLGTSIEVGVDTPLLRAAAGAAHVEYRVVG